MLKFFSKKLNRNLRVEDTEKEFRSRIKDTPLEKKDLPAMIIAAFLVLLPAVLLAFGAIVLLMFLFFR
ncbi:MAG TPA: hypothetical protein IAB51_00215 [Candidatus Merdivicinus excrementipullorum]|uniref:Uncharacterized protein n=1 Tax=Candidatus Merdivicinus excrementipullorum TaxID=2840867 RepID=A0A9D1FJW6_9FIRM|nr:hypothetical protein [Candidatus Merdivicinus excrementipullorum]